MAILFNINGLFAIDSSGAMEIGGAAGTATYVLMSNGAGNANSWYDVQSKFAEYLPLTGGTLTGNLSINGTNTLSVGGNITANDGLFILGSSYWVVSSSDAALQRVDARDDATNFSRLHWYGESDAGATSNFRHAYYDGSSYIDVTASAGIITYTGGATFTGLVSGITPTAAANFATKAYVDGIGGGVSKIIASTNITISPTTGLGDVTISATNTDTTYTSGNGITFTGTPSTVINADINYISYSGTNNFIVYGTQNSEGTTIPTGSQIVYADPSGTRIVNRGLVSDLPFTNNTGDLTSITLGNGLTGSSLTGPIPNILMSGSYTGTFTATSLASNSFLNNAGSLLFSAGQTTGTTRSLNLRTISPTNDPSSVDQSDATGITWGQRTDSNPYYIIYPKKENYNSSGNYSKLTIAWHTGIKIGANDAYGGTRFYDDSPDISGAAVILNVGVGNTNVGVVNNLTVGGDILVDNEIWLSRSNNSRNLRMTGASGADGGFAGFSSTGANLWQLYGSGNDYGFLNGEWAAWDLRKTKNSNLYMNNNTTYYLNTTSNSIFAGNLTIGGTLNVSNQGRFKSWYTSGSGLALEVGISAANGYVLTYNRDTNAYASTFIESTGIQFATHSSGKFYFTGGNVGIGTTSPFSKLQVGNATFTGANGMHNDTRVGMSNHGVLTGLMLASTYNDAAHPEYGLVFVQGPSTSSYNVWSISPDGPAKGSSLIFNYQAQSTNIHSPSNAKVCFQGSTGNVGIGTTSPRAVGSGYKGLEVSSPSSGSSLWLSGFSDTTKGYLAMDTGGLNLTAISNHSLTFGTNNSPKMTILSGGNVGIQNTSPGALLDVGATIHPNTTGIDVTGVNCIGLNTVDNHNWLPYTDGNNYYSANNHTFRGGTNNGPNYMVIDSSGNVGIGTTTPNRPLTIQSNSGATAISIYARSQDDYGFIQFFGYNQTTLWSEIAGRPSNLSFYQNSNEILRLGTTSYIYHNTGSTTFNANGYIYTQSWINLGGGAGIYSSTNSAHFYPNNSGLYGTWRIDGSKGGYTGINMVNNSIPIVIGMFDTGGNGGTYDSGSNWHTYWHRTNGCLAIAGSGTASAYSLYVHGAIYATSDIVAYSDRRSKENIITIDNALDKVSKIRGVYYTPKEGDDKSRKVGVIAQELNEILPEAVTYAEDVDQYGVDYGKITGLLIEAVKELQAKVKELENK